MVITYLHPPKTYIEHIYTITYMYTNSFFLPTPQKTISEI